MDEKQPAHRFETASAGQTQALGERIGRAIDQSVVIGLCGELGAGKTQLAKGICLGLGSDQLATSPTFSLCNYYQGRMPIVHVDTFRLKSAEELPELGLEDALADASVVLIEWADRFKAELLPLDLEIRIASTAPSDSRSLELRLHSPAGRRWWNRFQNTSASAI